MHAVATLTLLICVVCPIIQAFDYWDNELQTGQDTEYTLVLLSLCVGAACVLAKLLVPFAAALRSIPHLHYKEPQNCFVFPITNFASSSESPPLRLRI